MKNLKRAVALVLMAFMITASVTSCGDKQQASNSSNEASQGQESNISQESSYISGLTSETQTQSETESAVDNKSGTNTSSSKPSGTTSSNSKPVVVWTPGQDMIPASAMKLPNVTIKNKTVTILTHGGELSYLDEYSKKYGVTVKYDVVASTEKMTRLQKLVAANNSPDLFWAIFVPSLVTRNYVQAVDKYIDFDSDLWKGTKENHEIFKWGGKNYFVVPRFYKYYLLWYNKDIFEEAGETTPTELYKAGKWNWDTMRTACKNLTIDANKDGTPEQWGIEMSMMQSVLYTTGKGFISYNKNGIAINNIKSAEVARAINYITDLNKKGYIYNKGVGIDAFASGKVAMSWGHLWYRDPYKALIKTNSLGMVPMPRDPKADQYYTGTEAEAYYIVRGAKNPEGAAALLCALRKNSFDPAIGKKSYNELVSKGIWNQEFETMLAEIQDFKYTVFSNWATFDLGGNFGDFFTRPLTESWSKIAEDIAPSIDAKIQRIYSTNK